MKFLVAIFLLVSSATSGFTPSTTSPLTSNSRTLRRQSQHLPPSRSSSTLNSASDDTKFDELLKQAKLRDATRFMRKHPDLDLTRERWNAVFDVIEETTKMAEENSINVRREQEIPLLSDSRIDMTDMYVALKNKEQLRLFGAVQHPKWPAGGSKVVEPALLEKIGGLSMTSLTPKPSNILLYAGIGLAITEGLVSANYDISLNVLVFATIFATIADKVLLNGALQETVVKTISPGTQQKITKHEAGHFLCAYLLGCPVEGYVLSAWAARQDDRFGSRGVSAGTSFFDPMLSQQIGSNQIKRSSIDRYSIVVMAGIAAEAINYGQADGGAGDESALIAFMLQMNGGQPPATAPWNDITIRNQARWGALQAVMILREYKACYDALVDTLERGGSLGDCIYAIEKAGRDNNLGPLTKPLGMILENSAGGEWTTDVPSEEEDKRMLVSARQVGSSKPFNPDDSLETLAEYKKITEDRLKNIEKQLQNLD